MKNFKKFFPSIAVIIIITALILRMNYLKRIHSQNNESTQIIHAINTTNDIRHKVFLSNGIDSLEPLYTAEKPIFAK